MVVSQIHGLITSVNIVIVSPKAIANAADAEAWFRAVPCEKMSWSWHMTGEVFCPSQPCASTVRPMHVLNHSSAEVAMKNA